MSSQSDFIFGALIFGFLLFITARGELPIYIGFLLKSGPKNLTTPTQNSSNSSSGSNIAADVKTGLAIASDVAAFA